MSSDPSISRADWATTVIYAEEDHISVTDSRTVFDYR
jgi:hypothetical protein